MESVVRRLSKSAVAEQKPRAVEHLHDFLKRSPVVLFSGPVPEARKTVVRERLVYRRSAEMGLFFTTPGGNDRYVPLPGPGKAFTIRFLENGFEVQGFGAELRFEYADEPRR